MTSRTPSTLIGGELGKMFASRKLDQKVNRTAKKRDRSRDRRAPRHGEGDPEQARWMLTGLN